jgi:hypothetical protein
MNSELSIDLNDEFNEFDDESANSEVKTYICLICLAVNIIIISLLLFVRMAVNS